MERAPDSVTKRAERVVFWAALRASLGRVPVWVLGWAIFGLFGVIVAWPHRVMLEGALSNAYEKGAQLVSFSPGFLHDHATEMETLGESTAATGAVLVICALCVRIFFAGGWLQLFLERSGRHSMRRFFFGGARYFLRFLRVLLLTLLVLAAFDWLLFGPLFDEYVLGRFWDLPDGDLDALRSERDAYDIRFLRGMLHLAVFSLVGVWATYTRTRLAMHATRSAVLAGLSSFFTLLVHPIKTLRPMILLWLCEVAGLAIAGFAIDWMSSGMSAESGWLRVFGIFLAGSLALIWSQIVAGARYSAAVQVSHDVVAPLSSPDPWSERVGGPGGPQYPIDDSDEYGVSW